MTLKSVPVLEEFNFQPSVIRRKSDPPLSPSVGDRYIVIYPATGDWLGKEDMIATYFVSGWQFVVPEDGFFLFVKDEYVFYIFDNGWWPYEYKSGVRGYLSGTQPILAGSWNIVEFNSIDYDLQNEADSVNHRFVAGKVGLYSVNSSVRIVTGNNANIVHLGMFKNGSLHSIIDYARRLRSSNHPVVNGSCVVYLLKDEYIDIRFRISSGNNVSIGGGSFDTWVTITRI